MPNAIDPQDNYNDRLGLDQHNRVSGTQFPAVTNAPKSSMDRARELLPQLHLGELVQLTGDIGAEIKQRLSETKGAYDAYKRAARSGTKDDGQ